MGARTESSLIINRVVRRMMESHPDAFIGTIHDSVVTTPEYADRLGDILLAECHRVGIRPTIAREDYQAAEAPALAA